MERLTEILGIDSLDMVPVMFAYLFYRIDQRQFLAHIEQNDMVESRKEAIRIKEAMKASGYVMKNCKLYAWACWTARRLNVPMPKAAAFDVHPSDANVLRRLNLAHLDKQRGKLGPFAAYSLRSFDNAAARMLSSSELKNYVGKFVSKKMKFLIDSYGETRHDLEMQLREAAVSAWYKQYPRFDSELHMMNVAKAAIHNDGHTMITSLSNKSRQRLQRNADGSFTQLMENIDLAVDVAAPAQYGAALQDHLRALESMQHKLNDKAQEFLLCAAGQYHEGLSRYLEMDNDDAADTWPYPRYMAKVQKYFDVTPDKVDRLYESIRNYANKTNL